MTNTTQPTFLFVGDSLVADFDWQQRMPLFDIINYGIPGETVEGLLDRMPALQKKVEAPQVILLMIGANNLWANDFSFLGNLMEIIVSLTNDFAASEIIVNSLLPFKLPGVAQDAIVELNTHIETMTKQTGSCYLDMYAKFSNTAIDVFQEDGVHLTNPAYNIWARSILEYVAFLLEED